MPIILKLFLLISLSLSSFAGHTETTSGESDAAVIKPTPASFSIVSKASPHDPFFKHQAIVDLSNSFISSDGTIGKRGQEVLKAIDRVGNDCFMNKLDLSSSCSGFSTFSREKKRQFMAYFFGSIVIGELERTYGEHRIKTKGRKIPLQEYVKDQGGLVAVSTHRNLPWNSVGLYNLEDRQGRRRGGRNRTFCPRSMSNNSFSEHTLCAASMINDLHCEGTHTRGKPLPLNKSYWMALRTDGRRKSGDAQPFLKKFPGCSQ